MAEELYISVSSLEDATDEEINKGLILIPVGDTVKKAPSSRMKGKPFTFEDFTALQLAQLKGAKGDAFKYSDFTPAQLADLRLTWDKLTAAQKESLKLKFEHLSKEDIATLQKPATDAAKEAKTAANEATEAAKKANTAAENVKDGKTPVLSTGTIKDGDTASGELKPNGVDENDNPKYVLDLTLPSGKDGKAPVITFGAVITLEPNEEAKATVTPKGLDENEHPIFEISLSIPRGEKGLPGDGSGNVFTDITNLEAGKMYLFVPDANNSPSGEFVEYVEQDIPTKLSELTNDEGFQKSGEVSTAVNNAVSTHNTNRSAHADIRQELISIREIAEGAQVSFTFATEAEMRIALNDAKFVEKLKVGSNLLIEEKNVPDYWWSGSEALEFEVKIDLSSYKTDAQNELKYLQVNEAASDSNKLGGKLATEYALKTDATALHKSITLQPTAFLQSGDFFQAKVTDEAIKDGATIHSSCDLSSLDIWQEAQGVSASLDGGVGFFYVVCKKKPTKSLTIKYTIGK